MAASTTAPARPRAPKPDRYLWIALANTTAAIFMAALDGSVVIIALPAIFKDLPVGVLGTVWAYRKLRDNGVRRHGKIDWWGNPQPNAGRPRTARPF
jgi:hypothetical protein